LSSEIRFRVGQVDFLQFFDSLEPDLAF